MCRAIHEPTKSDPLRSFLIPTLESFQGGPPSPASCLLTGCMVVMFLVSVELTLRKLFADYQNLHPLLQDNTNRQILARHIGVDTLSCVIVATWGYMERQSLMNVWKAALGGQPQAMSRQDYDRRLYSYHAGGFRISLFFLFYMIKNLYDTFVWNDGPEFIFHHVLSIFTAYAALAAGKWGGVGHVYVLFFFGISEISTAVLCLLANFDEKHGVVGLGEAFPLAKVVLGGLFVSFFILCRCIMWPVFAYYLCRDLVAALTRGRQDPRSQCRRGWLQYILVSLTGISILQVAWLGQIFIIAQEELTKMGHLQQQPFNATVGTAQEL